MDLVPHLPAGAPALELLLALKARFDITCTESVMIQVSKTILRNLYVITKVL
jgi:hypothetical protein